MSPEGKVYDWRVEESNERIDRGCRIGGSSEARADRFDSSSGM